MLPDVLHSIRSLLCTATNCTPHERTFLHTRKSFNGVSLPSWVKSGPVFVKRHCRNKTDLLVEVAELLEANAQYAHVRLEDGREILVSLRDLAPSPRSLNEPPLTAECDVNENAEPEGTLPTQSTTSNEPTPVDNVFDNVVESTERLLPRRSSRVRRPVDRYGNNICT